jgi:hypothetical protein
LFRKGHPLAGLFHLPKVVQGSLVGWDVNQLRPNKDPSLGCSNS